MSKWRSRKSNAARKIPASCKCCCWRAAITRSASVSTGRSMPPPTAVGWPSYYTEDYAAQAQAFQTQLTSLICEGVFSSYPKLKVVLLESGWTWLPAHLWRLSKYWHGLRMEIPWVDRSPMEIVKTNVRLSLQPTDAPPDAASLEKIIEHMQS